MVIETIYGLMGIGQLFAMARSTAITVGAVFLTILVGGADHI